MVEHVAELVFAEMTIRVEDFGFVVEMVMKVESYDFEVVVAYFFVEFVGKDNSNMMEDIGNIEKISHKDFVLIVPTIEIEIEVETKVEIEIEIEAKVAAKNSNLVGAEDTFDC